MVTTKYPGLATHLRSWGLKVVEVGGWQTRSAKTTTFTPVAVMVHHTATKGPANAPSLNIITNGRTGVPGPLSQFLLARDGTVYLISGNRANHGGYGGPIAGIPKDSGNRYAWGIEAENDGRGEPWGAAQLNAYYRLTAALLALMKKDSRAVCAHKEYAPSRKIDPAGIDMNQFRKNVQAALNAGPSGSVTQSDPVLRRGDTGDAVKTLQGLLRTFGYNLTADGDFGPTTDLIVRDFQKHKGLATDGIVGAATWKALRANQTTTKTGGKRMIVRFEGDNHVYEVVGSILVHVTATAWNARGLTSADVQVLPADHALNQLEKRTEY